MNVIEMVPILVILLLLLTAFGMPLIKSKKGVFTVSLATITTCFVLSGFLLKYIGQVNTYILRIGPYDLPWGITFQIGYIETLMSLLFTGVSLMVGWYGVYCIHKDIHEKHIKYYY